MRFFRHFLLLTSLAAAPPAFLSAATVPAPISNPQRLILQLGDPNFAIRQSAQEQLEEMDAAALPSLTEAMHNPDPEIAAGAALVYRDLTDPPLDRRAQLALDAAVARAGADYRTAIRLQTVLARARHAFAHDCILLGHDYLLAGDIPAAIAAYHRAVDRINEVLAGDAEITPTSYQTINLWHQFSAPTGDSLPQRRAGLLLLIGRLQRDRLHQPAAAAATFARVVPLAPEFAGDFPGLLATLAADIPVRRAAPQPADDVVYKLRQRDYELTNDTECLRELALTQESLGKLDDAILTRARMANALLHLTSLPDDYLVELNRLIPQSPAARALPAAAALRQLAPPVPAPEPGRFHVDVLGAGGVLQLDARPFSGEIPLADLPPGPHEIAYTSPAAKIRVPFTTTTAAAPRLFINPQSPFRWTQTNLGTLGLGALTVASLDHLPNGPWIAALTANDRIYLATSADLITWKQPAEFPLDSVSRNSAPSLFLDRDRLWMTWSSNALSLRTRSTGDFHAWIASSADGAHWSPPRAMGGAGGPANWIRTPDGQLRFSTLDNGATAPTIAQLPALQSLDMHNPNNRAGDDGTVTCDAAGRFYMVFNEPRMDPPALRFSASPDGITWPDPAIILQGTFYHPQLLIDAKQAALFYQAWDRGFGAYLRTTPLGDVLDLSPPLQLAASPVHWLRDGADILGLTSGESPFLLRAPLAQILPLK